MPDRVPIGTLPGLTSQLDGIDILVATVLVDSTVDSIFLRHTDYDDSGASDTSVVGAIRNATGGGGDGIAFTIPDQTQSVTVAGSMTVLAGSSIYLRVTTGSLSMNLTGWVEVADGSVATSTALTSVAKVKVFLGITTSTDDALLNVLIGAVSDEIQNSPTGVGVKFLEQTETDEKLDVPLVDHRIHTLHWPIVSVAALTENDTALVEDTDFEMKAQDLESGQIVRIGGSGLAPISWARGRRVVKLTYDRGFASIPAAICQAATELVAFDYFQSEPGGRRLGLVNKPTDVGGSPTYMTRGQVWDAQAHRFDAYRRVA